MKTKAPYEITSKAIKGYDDSTIAKSETNDCVVRAFASAFDIQYDKAWKIVSEKFGRQPRQGTRGTFATLNKLAEVRYTCNYKKIKPIGVAIVMDADHFCMQWRGVKDRDSKMVNSVMRGAFLKDSNLRREFLSLLDKR
jgi:hypothetical protein